MSIIEWSHALHNHAVASNDSCFGPLCITTINKTTNVQLNTEVNWVFTCSTEPITRMDKTTLYITTGEQWMWDEMPSALQLTVLSVWSHRQHRNFVLSLRRTNSRCVSTKSDVRYDTRCYLTCARKPTWVSLIYRTEPTTKKCKTEKLKTDMLRSNSKSLGNPHSQYWRRKGKAAVERICRKGRF